MSMIIVIRILILQIRIDGTTGCQTYCYLLYGTVYMYNIYDVYYVNEYTYIR